MSGMWVGRSAPPAGLTRWASSHPAYGLLVLVFQEGWALEGVLSFEATGIIESWLPLFLFSILLGLSMDHDLLLMAATGPLQWLQHLLPKHPGLSGVPAIVRP